MRVMMLAGAVLVIAIACASAPRGSKAPTPLTSVDTAYYVVPGNTRTQWAMMLPRAARAAGIESGAPSYTVGHVMESIGGTRTTSIGCQVDRFVVQLRLGHVIPKLAPTASPSAEDRAAWDAFVGRLWDRAHLRESIGAQVADSLRKELKAARNMECQALIAATQQKLDEFPARYSAAVMAAEESQGRVAGPEVP